MASSTLTWGRSRQATEEIDDDQLWYSEGLPQHSAFQINHSNVHIPRINIPGTGCWGGGLSRISTGASGLGPCLLSSQGSEYASWTVHNGKPQASMNPQKIVTSKSGVYNSRCAVPFWLCGYPSDHVNDEDDCHPQVTQIISTMPAMNNDDWLLMSPERTEEPESFRSFQNVGDRMPKSHRRSCDASDLCGDAEGDTCWDRKTEAVYPPDPELFVRPEPPSFSNPAPVEKRTSWMDALQFLW